MLQADDVVRLEVRVLARQGLGKAPPRGRGPRPAWRQRPGPAHHAEHRPAWRAQIQVEGQQRVCGRGRTRAGGEACGTAGGGAVRGPSRAAPWPRGRPAAGGSGTRCPRRRRRRAPRARVPEVAERRGDGQGAALRAASWPQTEWSAPASAGRVGARPSPRALPRPACRAFPALVPARVQEFSGHTARPWWGYWATSIFTAGETEARDHSCLIKNSDSNLGLACLLTALTTNV